MLFRPLRQIADKFNTLQMGMVAANRVFVILETESQIEDNGAFTTQTMSGKIDLEAASFFVHQRRRSAQRNRFASYAW